MPTLAIVGLGPSDSSLLTIGALERLQRSPRTAVCAVPASVTEYLRSKGVAVVGLALDGGALLRGLPEAIDAVVAFGRQGDAALGVPGHPMLDVPGLPNLLRALERAGVDVELIPGVPRASLQATTAAPLMPLPPVALQHTWEELVEIMTRLRACCPWDREQTHESLLPYLVEEAHEVVEAVDESDP
ncbi:MAG: hypothetical protein JOY86_01625, partial [Candidatus Eremiobacteraeota bacterium]|nr:hypothetical protein [Candidatus Eremiobacteraeota bacterium]